MNQPLKKEMDAVFVRYLSYLQGIEGESIDQVKPERLSEPGYRRLIAQTLMPFVVTTAMEWSDQRVTTRELIELGNRAIFRAMREYCVGRDGDLFNYLTIVVEDSITSR